jgi:hypothetical protein
MAQVSAQRTGIGAFGSASISGTPRQMGETVTELLGVGSKDSIAHALSIAAASPSARTALTDFEERVSPYSSLSDLAVAGLILILSENPVPALQTRVMQATRSRVAEVLTTLAKDGSATPEEFAGQLAILKHTFREILPDHREHAVGQEFVRGLREAESQLSANGLSEQARSIRSTFPPPDFTQRWNGLGAIASEE